jgi:hypothetical protein
MAAPKGQPFLVLCKACPLLPTPRLAPLCHPGASAKDLCRPTKAVKTLVPNVFFRLYSPSHRSHPFVILKRQRRIFVILQRLLNPSSQTFSFDLQPFSQIPPLCHPEASAKDLCHPTKAVNTLVIRPWSLVPSLLFFDCRGIPQINIVI